MRWTSGVTCWSAFLAVVIVVCLCCVRLSERVHDAQWSSSGRKSFDRVVMENAQIRRSGYYGIDFITCGACRLEKRRMGHLRLGLFNTLVLEDLSVVLPPDDEAEETDGALSKKCSATGIASRLGVSAEFLRLRGASLGFSGLHIERFRLATLSPLTNVVPRLIAVTGDAKRDGLHLRNCGIIVGSQTNYVDRAVLKTKPKLALVWSGGEIEL